MRSRFSGFPPEGIQFLRNLARNNNREWFLPRKPIFEDKLKRPMRELVEAVNAELSSFAPSHITDPEKAIYRFYRDTRFSPDKTPYKDHIAAIFPRRGLSRHEGASYYFEVSKKAVGIAGGVYMPTPETLLAMREHIADNYGELRVILQSRMLGKLCGPVQGEQLSRVPKGFVANHPAADLLRYKQMYFYVELPDELATTPQLFVEVLRCFRTLQPFLDFMNKPLSRYVKKTPDLFI